MKKYKIIGKGSFSIVYRENKEENKQKIFAWKDEPVFYHIKCDVNHF